MAQRDTAWRTAWQWHALVVPLLQRRLRALGARADGLGLVPDKRAGRVRVVQLGTVPGRLAVGRLWQVVAGCGKLGCGS
jgi:hypothetical protein